MCRKNSFIGCVRVNIKMQETVCTTPPHHTSSRTTTMVDTIPCEIIEGVLFDFMDIPSLVAWSMTSRTNQEMGSCYLYDRDIGRRRIRAWCRQRRYQKEDFLYHHLSELHTHDLQVVGAAGFYLWSMDKFYGRHHSKTLLRKASVIQDHLDACFLSPASSTSKLDVWRRKSKMWTSYHTRVYNECLEELECEEHPAHAQLKKKYNLLVK